MKVFEKILTIACALFTFIGLFFWETHLLQSAQVVTGSNFAVTVESGQTVELQRHEQLQTLQGPRKILLQRGDVINSLAASLTELHFGDHGVVRLAPAGTLKVIVADAAAQQYGFELLQGKAWFNDRFSSELLNVKIGGAYLIPSHAVFGVETRDGKTVIYAYRHQLLVGLVPVDFVPFRVYASPDSSFLNSYLLTEGNQTTITDEKIRSNATVLQQILYSKLLKEFQYGLFDANVQAQDEWVKQNVDKDADLGQKMSVDYVQRVRDRGLRFGTTNGVSFQAREAFYDFMNMLTLDKNKRLNQILNNFFDHFEDGEYLMVLGRTVEAKDRFDHFQQIVQADPLFKDSGFRQAFYGRLKALYDSLAFMLPSDSFYATKKTVYAMLLAREGSDDADFQRKFLLIAERLNDVEDLLDTNPSLARVSLDQYDKDFTALQQQYKQPSLFYRSFLAAQNQLLDNLFEQYPHFYRDRYFAMKNRFEQQFLSTLPDDGFKNEEKQTIISTKIDFLKQLQRFFLADKIVLDDAKQIVFRLFREIDDLELPAEAQVAVQELFAKRLQDFGIFYRYLNAPEYVGTAMHGSSHQDQFNAFIATQNQQQVDINQVKAEILQGGGDNVQSQNQTASVDTSVVPTVSTDPAAAMVTPALTATPVSTDTPASTDTSPIAPTALTLTPSGAAADDPLTNVKVDSLSSDAGTPALKSAAADSSSTPAVSPSSQNLPGLSKEPLNPVSKADRVAKILLIQKLKAFGVSVAEDQLTIVSVAENIYKLDHVHLLADASVEFSFTLQGQENIVSNLVVATLTGEKSVEGTFGLADLVARVQSVLE